MERVSRTERVNLEEYTEQLQDQLRYVTAPDERQQLIDEFVAIRHVLAKLDKEERKEQAGGR